MRNWLQFYSLPLLLGLLPPLYIHHLALLVCATHTLLKSKLTRIEIQATEEMLFDSYNLLYTSSTICLDALHFLGVPHPLVVFRYPLVVVKKLQVPLGYKV